MSFFKKRIRRLNNKKEMRLLQADYYPLRQSRFIIDPMLHTHGHWIDSKRQIVRQG
jgi:hypothetical protein